MDFFCKVFAVTWNDVVMRIFFFSFASLMNLYCAVFIIKKYIYIYI